MGIGVLQEGAVVVVSGAACEEGDWGFEPDDEAEVAQEGEISGNGDDASTCGDDGIATTDQAAKGGGFALPERGFAFLSEDVGDGAAVGLTDDKGVGVDEIPAELAGDDFSDGGFAGAHESDEDDVG